MGALASPMCKMDIIFQLFNVEVFVPDSSNSSGNKQNVGIWFSQSVWVHPLYFSSLLYWKYYLKSHVFSIFYLQFYLNWVCVLPPDCEKYLKHSKSFPGGDTLILATLSYSLLCSFLFQDLYTFSLGLWSSPCQLSTLSWRFLPGLLTTIYVLMTFKFMLLFQTSPTSYRFCIQLFDICICTSIRHLKCNMAGMELLISGPHCSFEKEVIWVFAISRVNDSVPPPNCSHLTPCCQFSFPVLHILNPSNS